MHQLHRTGSERKGTRANEQIPCYLAQEDKPNLALCIFSGIIPKGFFGNI